MFFTIIKVVNRSHFNAKVWVCVLVIRTVMLQTNCNCLKGQIKQNSLTVRLGMFLRLNRFPSDNLKGSTRFKVSQIPNL